MSLVFVLSFFITFFSLGRMNNSVGCNLDFYFVSNVKMFRNDL